MIIDFHQQNQKYLKEEKTQIFAQVYMKFFIL